MNVIQVKDLVNSITGEELGLTELLVEDLSNVVDVGQAIINSGNVDNFVKHLVNKVGKTIFVNRKYTGSVPSVFMDSWEFGSILQKISADIPPATENESWELNDQQSYDPNVFYKPTVEAKFFNSKVTFEINLSFTELQVKESFNSSTELHGFINMLATSVDNSMTVKTDSLIMRTINNYIAEVAFNGLQDSGAIDPSATSARAINLLKLYNEAADKTLSVADCLMDADFNRFAAYQIDLISKRMEKISTLFNMAGKVRFTPKQQQVMVLLAEFSSASKTFLESGTYHNKLVALPEHDTVAYWQGSGVNYDFDTTSAIEVKATNNQIISFNGILGVLFDKNSLGVTNLDKRVTTNYNPKAEFYTNFYKFDAGYFNDQAENFVVFFVGEEGEG